MPCFNYLPVTRYFIAGYFCVSWAILTLEIWSFFSASNGNSTGTFKYLVAAQSCASSFNREGNAQ
jgi:hypothetical protein